MKICRYVHTHMKIYYSIPLAYTGSMLYAIPSLLDIYTIDVHSIHFQFCSLIAFPSLLEHCYILIQYLFVIYLSNLVLFLVSFNVYGTPSFSQPWSLSEFVFFLYTFYTFQFKFEYLVILSFWSLLLWQVRQVRVTSLYFN